MAENKITVKLDYGVLEAYPITHKDGSKGIHVEYKPDNPNIHSAYAEVLSLGKISKKSTESVLDLVWQTQRDSEHLRRNILGVDTDEI